MTEETKLREKAIEEAAKRWIGRFESEALDPAEVMKEAIYFAERALSAEARVVRMEGLAKTLSEAARLPSKGGWLGSISDRNGVYQGRDQRIWDELKAAIVAMDVELAATCGEG